MEQALDKQNTEREKGIYRVTVMGSIVNFLLLVFKFFAAFFGHSAAMLADAVHSLSDFVTDIIVILFVYLPSPRMKATITGTESTRHWLRLLSVFCCCLWDLVFFGAVYRPFIVSCREVLCRNRVFWHWQQR